MCRIHKDNQVMRCKVCGKLINTRGRKNKSGLCLYHAGQKWKKDKKRWDNLKVVLK